MQGHDGEAVEGGHGVAGRGAASDGDAGIVAG